MGPIIPEKNKQEGLYYAFTENGVELPVIDLNHAAFAREAPPEPELAAMIARAVKEQRRNHRLPSCLRKPMDLWIRRNSVLLGGMMSSGSRFLGGMDTYLMKLGEANLGQGFRKKLDARVAASVPALSLRLRMHHAVGLMVQAMRPDLAGEPDRPLCFLNIAGGPASDSLNTVLALHRESPSLLEGRPTRIHLLDLVPDGPAFGQRALQALTGPGAPLAGLDIEMEYHPYDWREPLSLESILARLDLDAGVVGVSSEGGLGDYGTDEEVQANLEVLSRCSPRGTTAVVSLTPDNEVTAAYHRTAAFRTFPRTPEFLGELAGPSGWRTAAIRTQPMNVLVSLENEK